MDELNVYQIALLLAGHDPADVVRDGDGNWPSEANRDMAAFLIALQSAVRSKTIKATCAYDNCERELDKIDWDKTTIHVFSLQDWLESRRYYDNFFLRPSASKRGISFDSTSPHYPPKLDAAIQAWRAVSSNPELMRGKSVKQALDAWLTENAAEFGLLKPDGSPNKLGIEEITKVANWKPSGGATPTPTTVR